MAKDRQTTSGDTSTTSTEASKPGDPGTQEGMGEMNNPGKPVSGTPTSPVAKPAATEGGSVGQPVSEPKSETRKPRQSQPMELAQLVQSEETMKRIAGSLPKHMTAERWISVLLTVNSGSPELQRCDPRSILRAALQGAVLGLDFNKTLREAYLIPRSYTKAGADGKPLRDPNGRVITWWEATFMPGYAGLRKLVMNGGDVLNVRSSLVYESELTGKNGAFVYQFSPDLEFLHRPCTNPMERGEIALAYAVAKLKTGEHIIEVMTINEVEKSGHQRSAIWQSSRKPGGQDSGPWVSDYDMMTRKTVLKRLCTQLPMSAEAQAAIDLDNQGYVSTVTQPGQQSGRKAIEQARRGRGADTLAERLGNLDPADDDDPENNGQEPLDASTPLNDTEADQAS